MQKMLSYVRRAVDQYHMIEEGDTIAVGVSGGKDSLALLVTLANLRRFYPKKFTLKAITLEMGYDEMDFSKVAQLCHQLDVEFITQKTQIKTIVFDIRHEENPCSLCAKMRRGALNSTAKENGCNKVALGHHYDDVIETVMMSLLYEGRFNCFLPQTYLDRQDITVIRPMIYTPESYIRSFARRQELPIVQNPCPADGNTKREEIKQLLRTLENQNHGVRQRIFGAIQRYPLRGWGLEDKA
jgi:tRNA(Ile)-lysidine synthase TilS/MesJ